MDGRGQKRGGEVDSKVWSNSERQMGQDSVFLWIAELAIFPKRQLDEVAAHAGCGITPRPIGGLVLSLLANGGSPKLEGEHPCGAMMQCCEVL
jgi:hypothetical protein